MSRADANPILDVRTGTQYRSKAAAGRALASEFGFDPEDQFVWFKILRVAPDRFSVLNAENQWVALTDPSAPQGSTRHRPTKVAARPLSGTRVTTVELDEPKLAAVRGILGTSTLRETIDRAFDEVLVQDARVRAIERLKEMDGLDLDQPEVMREAWR